MNSAWWKALVRRLREDRCIACRSRARLALHHVTYVRVGAELDDDLVTLCRRCHADIHYEASIGKSSLDPRDHPRYSCFRGYIPTRLPDFVGQSRKSKKLKSKAQREAAEKARLIRIPAGDLGGVLRFLPGTTIQIARRLGQPRDITHNQMIYLQRLGRVRQGEGGIWSKPC